MYLDTNQLQEKRLATTRTPVLLGMYLEALDIKRTGRILSMDTSYYINEENQVERCIGGWYANGIYSDRIGLSMDGRLLLRRGEVVGLDGLSELMEVPESKAYSLLCRSFSGHEYGKKCASQVMVDDVIRVFGGLLKV